MEIKTWVSGGFAGNLGDRDVWVLDTQRLSEADRSAVEETVKQSSFFDIPADLARAQGDDLETTSVQITDGDRDHTVSIDLQTDQKYREALDPIFQIVREKGAQAVT